MSVVAVVDRAIVVAAAARACPRYHPDAFGFVRDVVEHAHRTKGTKPHADASDVLLAFAGHAAHAWGLLAGQVLRHWRIQDTLDVGVIVYALIDAGALKRNEGDRLADFHGGEDLPAFIEKVARKEIEHAARAWGRAS